MYRTILLYEQLKERTGWSDYRLAQELEVSQSAVLLWKKSGNVMNDRAGQIAAQLLDLPEKTVLLSLAAERAMNDLSGPYLAEAAEEAIAAEKKPRPAATPAGAPSHTRPEPIDRMPFKILP